MQISQSLDDFLQNTSEESVDVQKVSKWIKPVVAANSKIEPAVAANSKIELAASKVPSFASKNIESLIQSTYIKNANTSFENLERDHQRTLQLLADLGDNSPQPSRSSSNSHIRNIESDVEGEDESMSISRLLNATILEAPAELLPLSIIPTITNSFDTSASERLSKSELRNILNASELDDFDYASRVIQTPILATSQELHSNSYCYSNNNVEDAAADESIERVYSEFSSQNDSKSKHSSFNSIPQIIDFTFSNSMVQEAIDISSVELTYKDSSMHLSRLSNDYNAMRIAADAISSVPDTTATEESVDMHSQSIVVPVSVAPRHLHHADDSFISSHAESLPDITHSKSTESPHYSNDFDFSISSSIQNASNQELSTRTDAKPKRPQSQYLRKSSGSSSKHSVTSIHSIIPSPSTKRVFSTVEARPDTLSLQQTINDLHRQSQILQTECTTLTFENKQLRQPPHQSSTQLRATQDIFELESLIKGYQIENERLVTHVKELKLDTDTKRRLEVSEKNCAKLSRDLEASKIENMEIIGRANVVGGVVADAVSDSQRESPEISILNQEFEIVLLDKDQMISDLTQTVNELNQILVVKDALIFALEAEMKTADARVKDGKDKKMVAKIERLDVENMELKRRLDESLKAGVSRVDVEKQRNAVEIAELHSRLAESDKTAHLLSESDTLMKALVQQLECDIDALKHAHATELIFAHQSQSKIPTPQQDQPSHDFTRILKHNLELEELLTQQATSIQQTRTAHAAQATALQTSLTEHKIILAEYQLINESLKKKLHHSTFMTQEQTYIEKIAALQTALDISETHIAKLKNQLEVGEMTRKAVHDNTLLILRKAQEESSKIALYQHDRALTLLSTQTTSQSTKIFDMEIKRLLAHLSRSDTDNQTLRTKIQQLEESMWKVKHVPEIKEMDDMKSKLIDAVIARESAERELDTVKRGLTCDQLSLLSLIARVERFEDGSQPTVTSDEIERKSEARYAKMVESKNREIMGFKVEMDVIVEALRGIQ